MDRLDLAVVGAGAAGTWTARAMQEARPDWSIAVFERRNRIGGRLRSVHVPGLDHPIELGGMRVLTSHRRVQAVIDELGIKTRPFDTKGGIERSLLRGAFGEGPSDPTAGRGYDLPADERSRSASDLALDAFLRIVPDARSLDAAGWQRLRMTGRYLDRPITDWSIAEALATIRTAEGHRFVTDAFGYDSGVRPHNVADALQFLIGGNDPNTEARVPVDGMDTIPRSLATRFELAGGTVHLGRTVRTVGLDDGGAVLRLDDGASIAARRVVLAMPVAALELLAADSPALATPVHRRLFGTVEGFPATKLYLWYDRPWWRHPTDGPKGIRTTTDLSLRKVFYFDADPDRPAAMLAGYTDGLEVRPILDVSGGVSDGAVAPASLLRLVDQQLRTLHPFADPPDPTGSAFMHWGSDPREIGWSFWRAGQNSDESMAAAVQPDPAVPVYICGESFSRSQSWVEGALETAEVVVQRLLA